MKFDWSLGGGGNLTLADSGERGVQNSKKNDDVINERPLSATRCTPSWPVDSVRTGQVRTGQVRTGPFRTGLLRTGLVEQVKLEQLKSG